jgi:hypothetical protein
MWGQPSPAVHHAKPGALGVVVARVAHIRVPHFSRPLREVGKTTTAACYKSSTLQPRTLRNPRQHLRADLDSVMKGSHTKSAYPVPRGLPRPSPVFEGWAPRNSTSPLPISWPSTPVCHRQHERPARIAPVNNLVGKFAQRIFAKAGMAYRPALRRLMDLL